MKYEKLKSGELKILAKDSERPVAKPQEKVKPVSTEQKAVEEKSNGN